MPGAWHARTQPTSSPQNPPAAPRRVSTALLNPNKVTEPQAQPYPQPNPKPNANPLHAACAQATGGHSRTFGALDPVQVTLMAPHLTSIYVSGWQSSSTASTSNEPGEPLFLL